MGIKATDHQEDHSTFVSRRERTDQAVLDENDAPK